MQPHNFYANINLDQNSLCRHTKLIFLTIIPWDTTKKKRIKYIYLTFATPRFVNVSVESLLNLILNIIYIGLRFRQQRAVKT